MGRSLYRQRLEIHVPSLPLRFRREVCSWLKPWRPDRGNAFSRSHWETHCQTSVRNSSTRHTFGCLGTVFAHSPKAEEDAGLTSGGISAGPNALEHKSEFSDRRSESVRIRT